MKDTLQYTLTMYKSKILYIFHTKNFEKIPQFNQNYSYVYVIE
jgi:hypothetical protein